MCGVRCRICVYAFRGGALLGCVFLVDVVARRLVLLRVVLLLCVRCAEMIFDVMICGDMVCVYVDIVCCVCCVMCRDARFSLACVGCCVDMLLCGVRFVCFVLICVCVVDVCDVCCGWWRFVYVLFGADVRCFDALCFALFCCVAYS